MSPSSQSPRTVSALYIIIYRLPLTFALSAQIMRHVLVDAARARRARKRGGDAVQVSLDEALEVSPENDESFLALNDALEALFQVAPRQAKVVELRYFGGLSEEETAEVMNTSPRTVSRDWKFARAWLMRQLTSTMR
jgi:RNA polymerase sigma-70 factor, ECF subfamily